METVKISLKARSNGNGLKLIFWFDQTMIGSVDLTEQTQEFTYEFSDEPKDHRFEIELQGKNSQHTVIDEQGQIIKDTVVEISDFSFDGVLLGHTFYEKTQYHHDHNGTTDPIQDNFYGTMGCNGRVTLDFSSPTFIWLLENM